MYIVGIALDNAYMRCSVVKAEQNIALYAYEEHVLEDQAYYEGTLFNYNWLIHNIHNFIKTACVPQCVLIISLKSSTIFEQLTTTNSACTLSQDFYYIQQEKISDTLLYKAGIFHTNLIQYKLLALKLAYPLITLTTEFITHYYGYKQYSTHSLGNNLSFDQIQLLFDHAAACYKQKADASFHSLNNSALLSVIGLYSIGRIFCETS